MDWAATQTNLGNALQLLGQREGEVERLEQAVAAYRAALEERTRERVPPDWAITQNTLGHALALRALSLAKHDRHAASIHHDMVLCTPGPLPSNGLDVGKPGARQLWT